MNEQKDGAFFASSLIFIFSEKWYRFVRWLDFLHNPHSVLQLSYFLHKYIKL